MLPSDRAKGFVSALNDSLRADVDPRASGHLAVHHQALSLELAKVIPGRPAANEIAVRDQNPRRGRMGAKHADRLAALNQQRFVRTEALELAHDCIEAIPVARRFSSSTIHDEILRSFSDVGIEVVHQHPQRRFLLPAFARDALTTRGVDRPALARSCLERLRIVLNSEICHVTVPMSANLCSATAAHTAAISVLSTRSRSRRGTMSRTRSCAVLTPRPGRRGALKSMPCAPHMSSMARMFSRLRITRRAFHAAPIAIGTTSSRFPSVGMVSTLAG